MNRSRHFADLLDGMEYREENLLRHVLNDMKAQGYVAVMGYSDDIVYLDGAINEEAGLLKTFFSENGIVESSRISPFYVDADFPWVFKTNIPGAERFNVFEDGEHYYAGLVFSLAECRRPIPDGLLDIMRKYLDDGRADAAAREVAHKFFLSECQPR